MNADDRIIQAIEDLRIEVAALMGGRPRAAMPPRFGECQYCEASLPGPGPWACRRHPEHIVIPGPRHGCCEFVPIDWQRA